MLEIRNLAKRYGARLVFRDLSFEVHAGQVVAMLAGGGEVGKRLDFLLQEMNRESNTVLSKTGGLGDLGLTITDLALTAPVHDEVAHLHRSHLHVAVESPPATAGHPALLGGRGRVSSVRRASRAQ